MIFAFYFTVIFDDGSDNRVFDSDCTTPDRTPGRCLRLTTCTALTTVSSNRLRRYFCGFEGSEPKVCCPQPRSEVPLRETTPRPVIRTPSPPRPVRQTPRPVRPTPTPRTTVIFEEEPRNRGPVTSSPITGTKPPFLPQSKLTVNLYLIPGSKKILKLGFYL